ncbi:MAG: thiamine diphosphokinase [Lachnospiraceae bacterium]|nr:thiamine diphosphokinase [Lachnospiraceae bacterium]
MEALIISGGHLGDVFAASYIAERHFDITIAVDAGVGFFYRKALAPDFIVGDFDSVNPKILRKFTEMEKGRPKILQFQPEKDETDTELAVRTAIEQGCMKIHILGATGSRMDHVMGNIHLLGMAMEHGAEAVIADANNRIRMVNRGIVLRKEEQYGDYVSLIPFTPQVTGLTLKGFKYQVEDFTLKCYHSLGVSNEIAKEQAEIAFRDGVLLVMESKD